GRGRAAGGGRHERIPLSRPVPGRSDREEAWRLLRLSFLAPCYNPTMSGAWLIDGYNLLHATGTLGPRLGPRQLEKARARLLALLHAALGETADVTVVFDAADAPGGVEAERRVRGVHVGYARGPPEADAGPRALHRRACAPTRLSVEKWLWAGGWAARRVQGAAGRGWWGVSGCQAFLAPLTRPRPPPRRAAGAEKKEAVSREEIDRWLGEFADVERDPSLREAFR